MAQITLISWLIPVPVFCYFIIMVYIAIYLFTLRQFKDKSGNDTEVSVVIACRNEEKELPSLLGDLASQIYPSDKVEVIVIDDHSTDNTLKEAIAFRNIPRFKIAMNEGKGKKAAIRTGVELSSSDLIITTDADCRMGNHWISSIVSFYEENKPDLIICPVVLQDNPGLLNKFQQLEFMSLQGVTAGTAAGGSPIMCNGANLAFSREAYQRNNDKLHEEIPSGDDIFLLNAIRKDKGKIMWLQSRDAVVTTKPAHSLRSLLSQRARWISKAPAIRDIFTVIVSTVTFLTIADLLLLLVVGLFAYGYLIILLTALIIKSIPDLMIIYETTRFHSKKRLLAWFLPSLFLYPFYGITTVILSPFFRKAWK